MKFRESKKKKMKKIRQRRIRKKYGYVIGMKISYYLCPNNPNNFEHAKVIDKTCINGDIYLLVVSDYNELFIYKVVDICKYAYVSRKKLKKYKNHFENPNQWIKKTIIHITDKGCLDIFDCGQYDYDCI